MRRFFDGSRNKKAELSLGFFICAVSLVYSAFSAPLDLPV